MLKLAADIAVRGLAMANAPDLFDRLHQFEWYGGTLRNMILNLNFEEGAEVLDIGCGPGGLTRDLANMGYRVTGIDQSRSMIRHAENNHLPLNRVAFLHADALNIPLKNDRYDAVISASLLNVVSNKERLISEMIRVTHRNGIVMAIFPTPLFTKNNAEIYANKHNLPVFQRSAITAWARLSRKLEEDDVVLLFETVGLKSLKIDTALGGMLSSISGIRR